MSDPRCYLANVSDDGLGCNLVLEDLSRTTRPGNQVAGCSVAEASAALGELALLHRSHWNGNRLDWLIDPTGPFSALWQQMYALGASIFHERFADRLDAAHLELIDKLVSRIQEWTAAPNTRNTFVHGDARVDNSAILIVAPRVSSPGK
jgi:fructosamine-3-kinase